MSVPTPSPIIVQVVGPGESPSVYLVPVIAGAFLLLGGFLTYLWTRANDKRRIETERESALTDELMEHAAELVALGREFSALGQKTISTSLPEFFPELVERSTDLIGRHSIVYNRFRLAMPQSIQKAVVAYSTACIALTVPPFDKPSMTMRLELHVRTEQELVNALRRLRGLTDLETTDARGSQQRKESFADRASAEMIRTLEEHGVDVANATEEDLRNHRSPPPDEKGTA